MGRTLRPFKVLQLHSRTTIPGRLDRCLIDQILEIRTAHPGTPTRNDGCVNVGIVCDIGHVVLEDGNTATNVGKADSDYSISFCLLRRVHCFMTQYIRQCPSSTRPGGDGRDVPCLSKRPGRVNALSSDSGKLVAAIMMTPSTCSNPSSSTNSWFRVCFM